MDISVEASRSLREMADAIERGDYRDADGACMLELMIDEMESLVDYLDLAGKGGPRLAEAEAAADAILAADG